MDELLEKQPEFYEIIPEFNSAGRLCNYGSGNNPKVIVPADEWGRFNQLAGRQHEIVDGVVVFNPDLEPCMPDSDEPSLSETDMLMLATTELYEQNLKLEQENTEIMLAVTELFEMLIGG